MVTHQPNFSEFLFLPKSTGCEDVRGSSPSGGTPAATVRESDSEAEKGHKPIRGALRMGTTVGTRKEVPRGPLSNQEEHASESPHRHHERVAHQHPQ